MPKLTGNERSELAALAGEYMHLVEIHGVAFEYAYVHILGGDGSTTVWLCREQRPRKFELVKMKLGDGTLHFKSNDLFRFAALRAKEAIYAVRNTAKERNALTAANPSWATRRRSAERMLRALQMNLPIELHSVQPPIRRKKATT